MVTTYTRGEPEDRAKLVAALQLLTEHYAGFGTGGPEVASAKLTVASLVTSYAMGQLVRRLVAEGYVREDRSAELLERGSNLEAGRGFVMSNEPDPLKAPLKEALKRAPKPKPATPPPKTDEEQALIDDLFS